MNSFDLVCKYFFTEKKSTYTNMYINYISVFGRTRLVLKSENVAIGSKSVVQERHIVGTTYMLFPRPANNMFIFFSTVLL